MGAAGSKAPVKIYTRAPRRECGMEVVKCERVFTLPVSGALPRCEV